MATLITRGLLCLFPLLLALAACDDMATSTPSHESSPSTAGLAASAAPKVAAESPMPAAAVQPQSPTPAAAVKPQPAQDPYADAKAAGASAVCADGTWSYSKTRSGACSSHGGVHWWTGNLGPAGPGAH